MKTLIRLSVLSVAILSLGCNKDGGAGGGSASVETDMQKVAYSIGFRYGQNLRTQQEGLDLSTLTAAIADGYSARQPKLTDADMQNNIQRLLFAKREEAAASNQARLQQAQAFLKDAEGKGFQGTKLGAKYRIVADGKGPKPSNSSRVTLRYKALLLDGTVVDSTAGKKDEVETFKVADLVPGLKEAVTMMPQGARWNVLVPPALAYGEQGNAKVPPNSLVVYDLELVSVR